MSDMTADQKAQLMGDVRVVISDAEELLRLGAEQTGVAATEWRGRVETPAGESQGQSGDAAGDCGRKGQGRRPRGRRLCA